MNKIFITTLAAATLCANAAFAQGYNYYNNSSTVKTRSMDDYTVPSQYRGGLKNDGKTEEAKFYFEGGIRVNKLGKTNFDENGETTVGMVTDSLKSSDMEADNGYGIAIKGGYDDTNNNRYEFEVSYEQNSFAEWNFEDAFGDTTLSDIKYEDSKITAMSFNLNYYRDFFVENRLSPYLGVGLGMSNIEFDTGKGYQNGVPDEAALIGKGNDQVLNYQLMAGSRITINENNKINLGYHYRGAFNDVELQTKSVGTDEDANPFTLPYKAHIVEISYQYLFGKL